MSIGVKIDTRGVNRMGKNISKKVNRASKKVMGSQARYVWRTAKRSIKKYGKSKKTQWSMPGQPPRTRTGRLKNSIIYDVNEDSALIGATKNQIGMIANTHEFGGVEPPKKTGIRQNNWIFAVGGHGPIRLLSENTAAYGKLKTKEQVTRAKKLSYFIPDGTEIFKGRRRYPKRPFMKTALEKSQDAIAKMWRDKVI